MRRLVAIVAAVCGLSAWPASAGQAIVAHPWSGLNRPGTEAIAPSTAFELDLRRWKARQWVRTCAGSAMVWAGDCTAPDTNPCHRQPEVENAVDWDGLLCASGERERACDAVLAAQSSSGADLGRWWRAPWLVGVSGCRSQSNGEVDGNGTPSKGRPSFSRDSALGAMAYLTATKDVVAATRWFQYLALHNYHDDDTGVVVPLGVKNVEFGTWDYCGFDHLQDLNINPPVVVPPTPFTPGSVAATVDVRRSNEYWGLVRDLRRHLALPADAVVNASAATRLKRYVAGAVLPPVPPPPFPPPPPVILPIVEEGEARDADDSRYDDATVWLPAPWHGDRIGWFQPHLLAMQYFIKQMMGRENETDRQAVAALAERRQPRDPFFEFLREGSSAAVAEATVAVCPLERPSGRTSWKWGDDRKQGGVEVYSPNGWECIFMVNLLLGPEHLDSVMPAVIVAVSR